MDLKVKKKWLFLGIRFDTHKAFHAFRGTYFLCVYKRIRLGHPRFDKELQQSGRNVQLPFLSLFSPPNVRAKFNGANYIHIGDFQGLEGVLCI